MRTTLLAIYIPLICFGQPGTTYLARLAYPHELRPYVDGLGPRAKTPGKERRTVTGTVSDPSGSSIPVAITHQLPNSVRIEIGGGRGVTIGFDGSGTVSSRTVANDWEDDLTESLTVHTPEGLLDEVRRGAGVRLLGQGFRTVLPGGAPDPTARLVDVVEVRLPVRSRSDKRQLMKRYYFDSETAKLTKVNYKTPAGLFVETRISDWRVVNGENVPGRVERFEAGRRVFTFSLSNSVFEAFRVDDAFRRP